MVIKVSRVQGNRVWNVTGFVGGRGNQGKILKLQITQIDLYAAPDHCPEHPFAFIRFIFG